jgi:hypothetical protein
MKPLDLETFIIWRDPLGELLLMKGERGPADVGVILVKRFQAASWESAVTVLHEINEQPAPSGAPSW